MRDHRTISIADQIFEQLEREILSGKYKRGDILSEQRLAEELGVSRTPVREAIRRLSRSTSLMTAERALRWSASARPTCWICTTYVSCWRAPSERELLKI